MSWGVAMCPRCDDEPLVMTFAFSGHEFICLRCGGLYGFLDPRSGEETPERLEKMEARKAEWLPIGRDLLSGGGIRHDVALARVVEIQTRERGAA
jgi:hypothetical protein